MRLMDRGCRLSRYEENRTVKRTVIVAAGVLALGVAVGVGKMGAQTGGNTAPAPAPQSKIALVNLSYVIKNYEKFKSFQEETKQDLSKFQKNDADYKIEGERLAKDLQLPTTKDDARDKIEKRLMELKRLVEDNKADANKVLGKKQEAQVSILYNDVRGVVWKIAQSRGLEAVFHYNDAIIPNEFNSPQNIARKMQAAFFPIYFNNNIDISVDTLTTLNSAYKNASPNAAAPGTR